MCTNTQGMSLKSFGKIYHSELEKYLYLCNFSKELSQLTDWQTYKTGSAQLRSAQSSSFLNLVLVSTQFRFTLACQRLFRLSMLNFKVKRTCMSFKSWLGHWRILKVPELDFSLFEYWHWSLIHPWSIFWLSISILEVWRVYMSFKSWFGDLEVAVGSWLWFAILIMIWMRSLVFDTPIFWTCAFYLDLKGAKNIKVLYVHIWGFGRCFWLLTGGWHLGPDIYMVTGYR